MALSGILRAAAKAMAGGYRGAAEGRAEGIKERTSREDRKRRIEDEMLQRSILEFKLGREKADPLPGSPADLARIEAEALAQARGTRTGAPPRLEEPKLITGKGGKRIVDRPGAEVEEEPDKPTLGETQARAFHQTVKELNPQITAMEQQGVRPSLAAETLSQAPFVGKLLRPAANYVRAPEQRQYRNLADRWAQAVLRLESKSAINEGEYDAAFRSFFLQPGEENDPAIVKQKQEAREQKEREIGAQGGETAPPPLSIRLPAGQLSKYQQYLARKKK